MLCVLMARPYGMSELGAVLRLAKSSLTGLVDRTERNGLVRREVDPRDTRAVRVALTAAATPAPTSPDPDRPRNVYVREDRILAHLTALSVLLARSDPAELAHTPKTVKITVDRTLASTTLLPPEIRCTPEEAGGGRSLRTRYHPGDAPSFPNVTKCARRLMGQVAACPAIVPLSASPPGIAS